MRRGDMCRQVTSDPLTLPVSKVSGGSFLSQGILRPASCFTQPTGLFNPPPGPPSRGDYDYWLKEEVNDYHCRFLPRRGHPVTPPTGFRASTRTNLTRAALSR